MARGFELWSQLAKVVDLAVENDPDGAVLIVNRLMARREVDDAEAPHSEGDLFVNAALHQQPVVVRSAMTDDLTHALQQLASLVEAERRPSGGRFSEAGDSTHMFDSY